MHRTVRTTAFSALALSTILLAGCTAEPRTEATPSADAAEPATITLYTSEPQEKADALVAAFNEVRPEITVEIFRAGTGDLTARISRSSAPSRPTFSSRPTPAPSRTTPPTTC
jgi:iron(III) transport system substrate-binding protein